MSRAVRHVRLAPVWPTLLVNWAFFAQVLSFDGWVIWVAAASTSVVLAMFLALRTGITPLVVVVGVALSITWTAAAELLGDDYSGPITRSALMATGATVACMLILNTRSSAAVLIPSGMLMIGALGLGAAGKAEALGGIWVVAVVVTLLMVGPYRAEDLRAPERLGIVVRLLLVGGLAAIAGTVVGSWLMGPPWESSGLIPTQVLAGFVASEVGPSVFDMVLTAAVTLFEAFVPPDQPLSGPPIVWVQVAQAVIIAATVLAISWPFARRAHAWVEWRVLRGRLLRGDARERAIGAWTWTRLRRAWREDPLPSWVTPDVAESLARDAEDEDLLTITSIVNKVAYNPRGTVSDDEADLAWQVAVDLDALTDDVTIADFWRWSRHRPRYARRLAQTSGNS